MATGHPSGLANLSSTWQGFLYYYAHGFLGYFLGVFNTWSYIIYIILWQSILRLNPTTFPEHARPKTSKRVSDAQDSNSNDENDDERFNSPLQRKRDK